MTIDTKVTFNWSKQERDAINIVYHALDDICYESDEAIDAFCERMDISPRDLADYLNDLLSINSN